MAQRAVKADELVDEVKQTMGEQLISAIYRDRIRTIRTRSYQLNTQVNTQVNTQINTQAKRVEVEVMHTLLGVELKVGKRRLLCPDLATARYLSVFARLGVTAVAVPYDITKISRLADDLESSWFRMQMLVEHLAAGRSERFRRKVSDGLIADQREEVLALGPGPAIPEFNQNTKQRKRKI